jgi:hypothetical protein
MKRISYSGYRFPPRVIQQAIWLYLRFTLSLRDVEDLLALPLGAVVGLGLGQLIVSNLDNDLFHVPLVVGWRSYAIAGATVLAPAALSFTLAARRLRDVDIPAVLRAGAA